MRAPAAGQGAASLGGPEMGSQFYAPLFTASARTPNGGARRQPWSRAPPCSGPGLVADHQARFDRGLHVVEVILLVMRAEGARPADERERDLVRPVPKLLHQLGEEPLLWRYLIEESVHALPSEGRIVG